LGWVTLVVALSTCAIVGFAVSKSPKTITAKEIVDRRAEFDPALGRTFDLASVGKARIVVAIGDCASCSVLNSDFNELKGYGSAEVVGLFLHGADTGEIRKDYEWFTLVEDQADLHTRLNAFFSPRAYVFDTKGALIAIQAPNEHLHDFVERSKGLL
jgi:hypothetical protein